MHFPSCLLPRIAAATAVKKTWFWAHKTGCNCSAAQLCSWGYLVQKKFEFSFVVSTGRTDYYYEPVWSSFLLLLDVLAWILSCNGGRVSRIDMKLNLLQKPMIRQYNKQTFIKKKLINKFEFELVLKYILQHWREFRAYLTYLTKLSKPLNVNFLENISFEVL